jgi:hypothetical protein
MLSAGIVSQEIIPTSSTLYEDMDRLYLTTGNGTSSNARPWTKTEAYFILSRIDPIRLDASEAQLYEAIMQEINHLPTVSGEDDFRFDVGFGYNLEAYYHTNGTDFDTDTEWVYGFEERKPMFKLDIGFGIDDFLYSFTDLQYGRNRFTDRDEFLELDGTGKAVGSIIEDGDNAELVESSYIYSQKFMTNVLYPTYDIDFQTPKRAIISIGGERWNMNFSRDRVKWGNGHSGNFIIDDLTDYQEFIRFTGFSDVFKYDLLYVFFETNPNNSEGSSADDEFRMFMAHRLEFRIFDTFTFAVSENLMYRNDVFNLRYLNPANIYHNLNNRSLFNAIAHLEIDYSPLPGVNIYGQYVLDQAVAPNESASQANAQGYLAGIEYGKSLEIGIVTTSMEYARTSPALYRREIVDFLMFRKYHGNGTSFISHVDYIGYQYGGDTQLIQWDAGLRLLPDASLKFRITGMRQGEVNYFTPNDEVNEIRVPSPSGNLITEKGIVSFGAKAGLPRFLDWLESSAWMQADFIGKRLYNKDTQTYSDHTGDIQLTVGMSLQL